MLLWFASYLSNRQRRVRVNISVSTFKKLKGAMPQGSWLGPLAFLVLTVYWLPYCIDLFSCIAASRFNKLNYLLTYLQRKSHRCYLLINCAGCSLYFIMGREMLPNCPFLRRHPGTQQLRGFWATRVHIPNGISIGSAVQTQLACDR